MTRVSTVAVLYCVKKSRRKALARPPASKINSDIGARADYAEGNVPIMVPTKLEAEPLSTIVPVNKTLKDCSKLEILTLAPEFSVTGPAEKEDVVVSLGFVLLSIVCHNVMPW